MQSLPRVIIPAKLPIESIRLLIIWGIPECKFITYALFFLWGAEGGGLLIVILFLYLFFFLEDSRIIEHWNYKHWEAKILHQQKYYLPLKMPTLHTTTVSTTSFLYYEWVNIYIGVPCKEPDAKTRTYATKTPPDSLEKGQPGTDDIPKRAIYAPTRFRNGL